MPNDHHTSPNTGSALATMSPNDVRKLWKKGADVGEQTEDFYGPMEGKSKTSLIETISDTAKGAGQSIRFTTKSGFYDEGKMGDETFQNEEDFEEILIDGDDLAVDFLRHASSHTMRTEEKMGMRGEIKRGITIEHGKWMGREKSHRIMMMLREQLPSDNFIYANSKTEATLGAADTLSYNDIVIGGQTLKPLGGRPAYMGKKNGNAIYKYCLTPTVDALGSLKLDPAYQSLLNNAANRGPDNCIFKGGYEDLDGHIIKEYNPIDHDGEGAIGSPYNPQARLGVAVVADATGLVIKGGGNATSAAKTKKKYFKDFRGYAYRFQVDVTLSVGTEEKYFLIVNPPNAATDPNKVGMYAYTTGNNGNAITVTKSLGSGTARVTTIGAVTYNSGIWSGYHTQVHPENALIVPCNAKGQPIGYTPILGQRFARRGYGRYRNLRMMDQEEGGFTKKSFILSVFGQALRRDRLQRVPGALMMVHALKYPGVKLPTIV